MKRTHVVRQGEYLDLIAQRFNLDAAAIWDDPSNRELRDKRSNPNLLAPGDLLRLVDRPSQTPLPVEPHKQNRFEALLRMVQVSVYFHDSDGPVADQRFVVLGLPRMLEGKSTPEGEVQFEAPIGLREARVLFVDLGREHPVRIGDLDPADETTGAHQRLTQLGYHGFALGRAAASPPPPPEDLEQHAVAMFQTAQGLEPTGLVDDATREALTTRHRT